MRRKNMGKLSEVKINIATAIAAAFGFVIALLWRDVIIGILKYFDLWREGGFNDEMGIAVGVVVVIVITILCVLGIMYISKWGGITKK
jgi:hypothetical protein